MTKRPLTEQEVKIYTISNERLEREKKDVLATIEAQELSLEFLEKVQWPYVDAKAEYEQKISGFTRNEEKKQITRTLGVLKEKAATAQDTIEINNKFLKEGVEIKEIKEVKEDNDV